jgi:hypothetical protein
MLIRLAVIKNNIAINFRINYFILNKAFIIAKGIPSKTEDTIESRID